jgi:hypothetical protein
MRYTKDQLNAFTAFLEGIQSTVPSTETDRIVRRWRTLFEAETGVPPTTAPAPDAGTAEVPPPPPPAEQSGNEIPPPPPEPPPADTEPKEETESAAPPNPEPEENDFETNKKELDKLFSKKGFAARLAPAIRNAIRDSLKETFPNAEWNLQEVIDEFTHVNKEVTEIAPELVEKLMPVLKRYKKAIEPALGKKEEEDDEENETPADSKADSAESTPPPPPAEDTSAPPPAPEGDSSAPVAPPPPPPAPATTEAVTRFQPTKIKKKPASKQSRFSVGLPLVRPNWMAFDSAIGGGFHPAHGGAMGIEGGSVAIVGDGGGE